MAETKTKRQKGGVTAFLDSITDPARRAECRTLAAMMQRATGAPPQMWGPSIVGFGNYHYRYESGREGDWFLAGFSPRAKDLTVYVVAGFDDYPTLMKKLGKYRTGRSCLYLRTLEDVDSEVLEELVTRSARDVAKRHGTA